MSREDLGHFRHDRHLVRLDEFDVVVEQAIFFALVISDDGEPIVFFLGHTLKHLCGVHQEGLGLILLVGLVA